MLVINTKVTLKTHQCFGIHISVMMMNLNEQAAIETQRNTIYAKGNENIVNYIMFYLLQEQAGASPNSISTGCLCLIPMELLPLVEQQMVVVSLLGDLL